MFSFVATSISEIMPISSFGIFATILMLSNYLLVITSFPAILINIENYYIWRNNRKLLNKQVRPMKNVEEQTADKRNKENNSYENVENGVLKELKEVKDEQLDSPTRLISPSQSPPFDNELTDSKQLYNVENLLKAKKLNIIERFFKNYWRPIIYKLRPIILFIFSGLLITFIVFTTQLTAPPDMEEFLPETSILKKGQDYLKDGRFHSSVNDNLLNVDIIWGIEGTDRQGTSHWDPEDLGEIIWDSQFNLASVESQNQLLEICNQFQTTNKGIILQNSLDCFLYDFISWLKIKGLSYPVEQSLFEPLLYEYSLQEIAFEHLTNYRIGFVDQKLRFVSIGLVGSTPFIQARADQLPIFEEWEAIVEELNQKGGQGLEGAYQDAGLSWQWMASEKAFIKNAIQGLYLSGTFAFIVMLLFTQNIIITLFCILSIAGIVCGVLAITKWQGWYLGVMESVNCSIVIGFSVDYIIHIAHSYTKCKDDTRIKKIEFALTHMGISVLGGGVTTFGAGIFLLFAELMFFTKMGILLMSTIALSLSWSLIFFPALVQTIGPVKNQGSIEPYTNAIIGWIKKKLKKS